MVLDREGIHSPAHHPHAPLRGELPRRRLADERAVEEDSRRVVGVGDCDLEREQAGQRRREQTRPSHGSVVRRARRNLARAPVVVEGPCVVADKIGVAKEAAVCKVVADEAATAAARAGELPCHVDEDGVGAALEAARGPGDAVRPVAVVQGIRRRAAGGDLRASQAHAEPAPAALQVIAQSVARDDGEASRRLSVDVRFSDARHGAPGAAPRRRVRPGVADDFVVTDDRRKALVGRRVRASDRLAAEFCGEVPEAGGVERKGESETRGPHFCHRDVRRRVARRLGHAVPRAAPAQSERRRDRLQRFFNGGVVRRVSQVDVDNRRSLGNDAADEGRAAERRRLLAGDAGDDVYGERRILNLRAQEGSVGVGSGDERRVAVADGQRRRG
mmetsp:Transcript_10412/g.34463  ORF Transcript_10412/g.34463 Transcript_10412/m.34463 type:complete len:388 (+) Transcript_10412:258-1421(+)